MKEDIKPKDGKRKLYFSIDMQSFISYTLDLKTTCNLIFEENKNTIYLKLCEVYNNSTIDTNNFDFFLVDLKGIKKAQGLLTKIRLNRDTLIYYLLQSPNTILCFLQKNALQNDLKIKAKNEILCNRINANDNEKLNELKKNYLNNKQLEDFYTNKTVYFYNYDNHYFVKSKANLSEKQITIHGKIDKIILIQDIISVTYTDSKDPMIEPLPITSGSKLPFCIIFKTDEQIIIGLKKEEKLKKWKAGIDFVITNYKNFKTDIDMKISVNNFKNILYENGKNIIEDTLIPQNLLKTKEKQKIFYSLFENKDVSKLVESIFQFQDLIENNKFEEGIYKLYEILKNVEKKLEEEKGTNKKSKISEIVNNERLFKYADIYNKANDLIKDNSNMEQLKTILTSNLFDDSLLKLKPYIKQYKEEFKKLSQTHDKKDIRKNIQSLGAFYFMKLYNINEKDSFLEL